jgi:nucleotide-binding universal stress UspA family protein
MHTRFDKIMAAIDGSNESMDAASCAIGVAKRCNAILTLLTVLPKELRYDYEIDRINSDIPMTPVKGIVELSRIEVEDNWFTSIREKARNNNVRIETEVVMEEKSVVSEILDYAEKQNIDLIVIGSKGKTGLRRMLLGSVTQGVLTYAHCPVLLVR